MAAKLSVMVMALSTKNIFCEENLLRGRGPGVKYICYDRVYALLLNNYNDRERGYGVSDVIHNCVVI